MQAIDPALPSASAEEARTVTTAATTVFLTLLFINPLLDLVEGSTSALVRTLERERSGAMRA